MAAFYFDVKRDEVLAQLRGDAPSKLQALAQLAELGAGGEASLHLDVEVAGLLEDPAVEVQLAALDTFGAMGELAMGVADRIVALLVGEDDEKTCCAVVALGMIGVHASRFAADVSRGLEHRNATVRAAACIALGAMGAAGFAADVAKLLKDQFCQVLRAALGALPLLDRTVAAKHAGVAAESLRSVDRELRLAALAYFVALEDLAPAHAADICMLLRDEDTTVRQGAVAVFAALTDKREVMVDKAATLLSHRDSRFKAAAALAVGATKADGKSKAGAIAELLADTTEDQSQLVNSIAGIERRAPSAARIPACAAMTALGMMGDTTFGAQIAMLLVASSPLDVRITAAVTLGELGGDFEDALLLPLDAPQASLRSSAAAALGKLAKRQGAKPDVAGKVAECLEDKSPVVRAAAAEALGCMGDEGAAFTEALLQLFDDSSGTVRVAAIKAFAGVGVKGQVHAPYIARKMGEEAMEVADVKIACVETLALLDARGSCFADEVAVLTGDQEGEVRAAALRALAKMGRDGAPFLAAAAKRARYDSLQEVRDVAESLFAESC